MRKYLVPAAILLTLATLTIVAVLTDDSSDSPVPASSVSDATQSSTLVPPTTTSSVVPAPATAPARHPGVTAQTAVKPVVRKLTTTTIDRTPESAGMGEDFPSPLQV